MRTVSSADSVILASFAFTADILCSQLFYKKIIIFKCKLNSEVSNFKSFPYNLFPKVLKSVKFVVLSTNKLGI